MPAWTDGICCQTAFIQGSSPSSGLCSSCLQKKRASRRAFSEGQVTRRTNPTRSARPPEKFALENFTVSAAKFAEEFYSFRRRKTMSGVFSEHHKQVILGLSQCCGFDPAGVPLRGHHVPRQRWCSGTTLREETPPYSHLSCRLESALHLSRAEELLRVKTLSLICRGGNKGPSSLPCGFAGGKGQ